MEGRRVVTEVDSGTCYNIHELTAGSNNYGFKKTSMASCYFVSSHLNYVFQNTKY
jgi:hypothetical protein